MAQDQTFNLTVITDTYGQAPGRNPEHIRVQRDDGTKHDHEISDLGANQAAPSPNLTPDFVIFSITAKAGEIINVMGMKTTADTRIGICGVAFEALPPSGNG